MFHRSEVAARRRAAYRRFMRDQGVRVFDTIMYAFNVILLYALARLMGKGRFGRLEYWAEDQIRERMRQVEHAIKTHIHIVKLTPGIHDEARMLRETLAQEDAVAHKIVKKLFARMYWWSRDSEKYKVNPFSPVASDDEFDYMRQPRERDEQDSG